MITTPTTTDQLPPNDVPAETCALASMMLAGEEDKHVFLQVRGILSRADFYQPDHQIIFGTLCDLDDAGTPIDSVTLCAELKRRGVLADVGGKEYIREILNA